MSVRDLAIVGAGGFGREVLDVLRAVDSSGQHWRFAGFVDDAEPDAERLRRINAQWIGTVDQFLAAPTARYFVIGIGDPATRHRVAERLGTEVAEPATLVHPRATIGADVELGSGTIVCSHVSITTNVRLGSHVHVNLNSTVGHDCRIGDFVTINPLVAVSGDVTLEPMVTMGTHSSVLQGLLVGAGAFVGAGAVVTKDVERGTTVLGRVRPRPMA